MDRYIDIKMQVKRNILIIIIENSSNIKELKKSKRLITSKKDRKNHGLGHISVNNIIKRYNGNIIYENKNNKFSVKAHLMLK